MFRDNLLTINIDRENISILSKDGNEELTVRINDKKPECLRGGDTLTSGYKKMGNHYYTYNDLPVRIDKDRDLY